MSQEPVKIVVSLKGGLVQDVSTFGVPVDVLVLDFDTDGADTDRIKKVGEREAYVSGWVPRIYLDGFLSDEREDIEDIAAEEFRGGAAAL